MKQVFRITLHTSDREPPVTKEELVEYLSDALALTDLEVEDITQEESERSER